MIYRDLTSAAVPFLAVIMMACTPNQRIANSSAETPVPIPVNAAPPVSNFDSDLQAMRNADFKFILVFRRKDAAVLTPDDKVFANANGPQANRRKLADDGKAIIIGSNFQFPPGTLEKMSERFIMKDYSKPDSGPMVSNAIPTK